MPIIISGLDPWKGHAAYLAGYDRQQRRMEQDQEMELRRKAQQDQYQLAMQKAMLEQKEEEAKAAKEANERAQMGDAQGMEQQNMISRARGLPPDKRRLMDMSNVLGRISDPKARGYATAEFERYEKELQAAERKQAALGMIDKSGQDGHIDPEQYKARLEAGEEPEQLAKEVMATREKRIGEGVNQQLALESIAEAEQFIKTIPKGTNAYKHALAALVAFKDSPSEQRKANTGQAMLKTVHDAAALSAADERRVADEKTRMAQRPMIGLGGMGPEQFKDQLEKIGESPIMQNLFRGALSKQVGEGGPGLGPDYKRFAEGLKAEKAKRYPKGEKGQSLRVDQLKQKPGKGGKMSLKGGKDPLSIALDLSERFQNDQELVQRLTAMKVPLTVELLDQLKAARAARRDQANAEAGADR